MGTPIFEPRFTRIFAYTLQMEGGYVNDLEDPGLETKYGISKRAYPSVDITNLTLEDAKRIYYRDYYKAPRIQLINDYALAAKTLDLAVNCGHRTAIKMLQRAINQLCAGQVPPQRKAPWRQRIARLLRGKPLAVDGIIGTITLDALGNIPYQSAVLMALKGEAYQHYIKQKKPLYLPGWLKRLGGDA